MVGKGSKILGTITIVLSLGMLWLGPAPVGAPSPCSVFAVCIHMGVFQPVQVVWQDDSLYPPNDLVPGGPGGLPFIDSGDNVHWNASFPMIAFKNTYLFGTLNDFDGNRSTIDIFVSDTIPPPGADPVQLQITVNPPGTVIFTSSLVMVPRGGAILVQLPAPIPLGNPFQFTSRGLAEISMKTIVTPSANQLIVHTDVGISRRGLDLVYMPIAFEGDIASGGGPIPGVTLPTGNDFVTMVEQSSAFVQAVFPLNETELHVSSFPDLIRLPNPPAGVGDRERFEIMRERFQLLGRMIEHETNMTTQIVVVVPDYHAHLPDKSWKQHWFGGSVRPSEAYEAGGAPNVVFVELGYWQVVAHEITHNILRSDHDHAVADGYWVNRNADQPDGGGPSLCVAGTGGIAGTCKPRASLQNVPVSSSTETILAYHSLSMIWPAKKNVSASFESFFDPFFVEDPEVVVVSGQIFGNNTASLDNFYRFPLGTPSLALRGVGNYSIVFRDTMGSVLGTTRFNMSLTFTPSAFEPNPALVTLNPNSFSFITPWITGTRTIQLVNATNSVLASRQVSTGAPVVTVTSPNGGETFFSGSHQNVTWTGSDPDGDSLTYNVLYSGDNGTSWLPLATGLKKTSVTWNMTGVPSGNKYLVRVIATDGVNTGEGVSARTFSVVQPRQIRVSKFFTDTSLNPLPLDQKGNPKVDVVLAGGVVRSTNPGEIMAWVNVTNTDGPLQSLRLNETLPMDWVIAPPWMPALGAIHVFFANTTSLATNPEITQPSTITVSGPSPPQTVHVAIPSFNATAIGHPLLTGQSILLEVKLDYGLDGTSQSASTFPRNYTDTAKAIAWTMPSFTGTAVGPSTGTGFFTAYAKVVGDINGDFKVDIVDAFLLLNAYNTRPGDARWNPAADLNNDGVVDFRDATILSQWYGTSS